MCHRCCPRSPRTEWFPGYVKAALTALNETTAATVSASRQVGITTDNLGNHGNHQRLQRASSSVARDLLALLRKVGGCVVESSHFLVCTATTQPHTVCHGHNAGASKHTTQVATYPAGRVSGRAHLRLPRHALEHSSSPTCRLAPLVSVVPHQRQRQRQHQRQTQGCHQHRADQPDLTAGACEPLLHLRPHPQRFIRMLVRNAAASTGTWCCSTHLPRCALASSRRQACWRVAPCGPYTCG